MKILSRLALLFFASILLSWGSGENNVSDNNEVKFILNLLDRSNDTFKVQVTPPTLTAHNNIYQFASTAPGTYQIMDIGRFVKSFKAFNNKGNELETKQISTNQYELTSPEKIAIIEYHIAETWDTKVDKNRIYLMCGTSIEKDHVLINGQAVFGYFKGKQSNPIKIKIDYPSNWNIGTALSITNDGYYLANNYDHVVDSPFLIGDLTNASMLVQGTSVDIFTYSKTGKIASKQIMESIKNVLLSASGFLNGLPVKHYTFLFHFENTTNGAWEHSYSSEYVYKEDSWEKIETRILKTVAHEFFHVVTPLNIHSEIIDQFNFITPVPSKHLWLYEGVTEWAAHMMLFRSGLKSSEDYFKTLQRKVLINKYHFNPKISLLDLALKSYTTEGHNQFRNVYMKGALVAGLLDIRLLELSNGNLGLIDVINAMTKKYGPNKPFTDATFFDEFTKETYPEINEFFKNYIMASEELPLKEYYEKVGIRFIEETILFSFIKNPTEAQLILRNKWKQTILVN